MVFLTKNKGMLMGLNFIGLLPKSFASYPAPYDLSIPSTFGTIQHLIHDVIKGKLNNEVKTLKIKTVEDFETIFSIPADIFSILNPEFKADLDVMASDKFEELVTKFHKHLEVDSTHEDLLIDITARVIPYKALTENLSRTIPLALSIYNKLPDGIFKQGLAEGILKVLKNKHITIYEETPELNLLKQIDGFNEKHLTEIFKCITISCQTTIFNHQQIKNALMQRGNLTQGEAFYIKYLEEK